MSDLQYNHEYLVKFINSNIPKTLNAKIIFNEFKNSSISLFESLNQLGYDIFAKI
jgi:hypothetical protein